MTTARVENKQQHYVHFYLYHMSILWKMPLSTRSCNMKERSIRSILPVPFYRTQCRNPTTTYRLLPLGYLFLLLWTTYTSTATMAATRMIIISKTNTGTPAMAPSTTSSLRGDSVVGGGGEAVGGGGGSVGGGGDSVGGGTVQSSGTMWDIVIDYIESCIDDNTMQLHTCYKYVYPK